MWFEQVGLAWEAVDVPHRSPFVRVGIFPGSRLAGKRIPTPVVEMIRRTCISMGLVTQVFILEEEPRDPGLSYGITTVPRDFKTMIHNLRGMDAVISADSMPAHLAEYFGIPVFVVSHRPNPYWLPLSALQKDHWMLFEEEHQRLGALERFLRSSMNEQAPDCS